MGVGAGMGCSHGWWGWGGRIRTTDWPPRRPKHVTHISDNGSPLDPYLGAQIRQISSNLPYKNYGANSGANSGRPGANSGANSGATSGATSGNSGAHSGAHSGANSGANLIIWRKFWRKLWRKLWRSLRQEQPLVGGWGVVVPHAC